MPSISQNPADDENIDRTELSDETLLEQFKKRGKFAELHQNWDTDTTKQFCCLARAVNNLGLDWWVTSSEPSQLRFGRKETRGNTQTMAVGLVDFSGESVVVRWEVWKRLNKIEETKKLTEDLVERMKSEGKGKLFDELAAPSGRKGNWPDAYPMNQESSSDKAERNHDTPDDRDTKEKPMSDNGPTNRIYYGPPGTGKTFKLQELLKLKYTDEKYGPCYEFVTFHQSYGYEEFVEGLRPVIAERTDEAGAVDASTGEIRYEIKSGAFKNLCDRARDDQSRRYAMVIDEINRGNISKIFGELITLVEVDKRERSDEYEGSMNTVIVTLPYSGEKFSVPYNVDVIGTMNTADRSLALVDTALRRRFEFIESMPDPSVLKDAKVSHLNVEIDVEQMLTMLNKRIEALYDREHTVGHAYFTRLASLPAERRFNELKAVFKNKIIPLLEEYFFEDWQKIRLVLGDNQKLNQDHQFVHEVGREGDLLDLFGHNHGLDQYTIRSRYQLNAAALDRPNAYVGIYAA